MFLNNAVNIYITMVCVKGIILKFNFLVFNFNANYNILLRTCICLTAFVWKKNEVRLASAISPRKNFYNSFFSLGVVARFRL